jgi:hypothetical protein
MGRVENRYRSKVVLSTTIWNSPIWMDFWTPILPLRPLILTLFLPGAALAQDAPSLAFPVDCVLGDTCMIQQLVDRDPGPDAVDFLCGSMTYDGHTGTDIRVPDMEAMAAGVRVLAAAAGTVAGTRDGVPDTGQGGFPEGQDCGNGVRIEHGDGWETQYCHLALGSILVAEGDRVETGQPLGEMGFSGNTEFPHLHLTLRHNGREIDPFNPTDDASCGADATPLWSDAIPLAPGGILSAGFADDVPDYEAIQAGTADAESLPEDANALVLWGFFHHGRIGDVIRLIISDPSGAEFHSQDVTLDRTQAQLFRASGLRNRAILPAGTYTGTVTMIRDGIQLDTRTITIPID